MLVVKVAHRNHSQGGRWLLPSLGSVHGAFWYHESSQGRGFQVGSCLWVPGPSLLLKRIVSSTIGTYFLSLGAAIYKELS